MRYLNSIYLLLFSVSSVFSQDTLFYANNHIKAIGAQNVNGDKIGKWIHFYKSGGINAKLTHDTLGRLNGEQFYYDEKGNFIAKEYWKMICSKIPPTTCMEMND